MRLHCTYPRHTPRSFFRRNRQDILRSLFLIAGYTCLLVNLLTGGILWSLIAIGGLCVVWITFIYRPMVENTLIKKFSDISIVVCLYLFLLDGVTRQGWSDFVVPIVFFSDMIFIGAFYLLFFRKQKRNFLPLFELVLGGLVAIFCGLIGLRQVDWPLIAVGGVSLGLVILSLAIFPTQILQEFRKKFHT